MQKSIITNNFGFLFPTPMVIVGFVFIVAGIVGILSDQMAGTAISIVGGLIALTFNGIRIDTENKRYKIYSQWFGIRSGKWKSMDRLPYLSVMNLQSGYRMASRSNRTIDIPETTCCVCLLTDTHRQKVVIATAPNRSIAQAIANEFSEKLEKEIVQYSPVITEQTRARR